MTPNDMKPKTDQMKVISLQVSAITVGNGETCDNFVTVLTAPTILQSPGYPTSYQENALCRWRVEMSEESRQRGVSCVSQTSPMIIQSWL